MHEVLSTHDSQFLRHGAHFPPSMKYPLSQAEQVFTPSQAPHLENALLQAWHPCAFVASRYPADVLVLPWHWKQYVLQAHEEQFNKADEQGLHLAVLLAEL